MARVLFWGLMVVCILLAVRMAVRGSQRLRSGAGRESTPNRTAEAMVACAHCGIYLPRSEALILHGQTWCCHEHADQHGQA